MAKKLDENYSPQGVRIVFCDDVYRKRQDDGQCSYYDLNEAEPATNVQLYNP